MTGSSVRLAVGAAVLLTGAGAGAQVTTPKTIQGLLACRAIESGAARLACFDARAAEMDKAVAAKDIVVAERSEVRKARRSLFGLTLPSLAIFGGGDDGKASVEDDDMSKIESTIATARLNGNRRWLITLEDGAKWIQIDTKTMPRNPRPGMKIVIRRAAMGSFLANIDGQIAIRVKREN